MMPMVNLFDTKSNLTFKNYPITESFLSQNIFNTKSKFDLQDISNNRVFSNAKRNFDL